MATPVVFKVGTRAQYDALIEKNPNALYFLTDTHEFYHGSNGMAQSAYHSDIKTIETNDLDVIINYYNNNKQYNIFPVKGDIFAVKTLIKDETYSQSIYMYDGQDWQNINSTAAIVGDDLSIEVRENNIIALKDYGKRFYKFIAEIDDIPSHYELVEVSENNPWVAGLEPRVTFDNGEYIIGWYEPNLVTVEGVQNQVSAVQAALEKTEEDINNLKQEVLEFNEILNGTEDIPGGLIEEVETLEDAISNIESTLGNYYTKEQTYNREEIDGKVSGVFHFKDTLESIDMLPVENNIIGDVYQVGEHEYVWNGTTWVELGFVVDLSNYATKTDVNNVAEDISSHITETKVVLADLDTRVGDLEAIQAEKNTIVGININGVALDATEARIINLPVFTGTMAGLVPSADNLDDKENLFLNASGPWSTNRIGDLGNYTTVIDYVESIVKESISWGGIE